MSSLSTTQTSIQDTKTALLEMKESLGNRRADLAQLWTRGQTLDEMIKIVDEMSVS
jgi:exocyst complex component 4